MSIFDVGNDRGERYWAEFERRQKVKELEQIRAIADEDDAVVYLAGILSKEMKKALRSEVRRDHDFFAHMGAGSGKHISDELEKAGFKYEYLIIDGVWYPWLLKAIELPEKHVVSLKIRRKIWKYRFIGLLRSLRRPVIGWGILASVYAISFYTTLMKARLKPIYVIPVIFLVISPVFAGAYLLVRQL